VLGPVDNQELPEQADAWESLMDTAVPFRIADAPLAGWTSLYSLDGRWFPCRVERMAGGPLWLSEAAEAIRGGMSGSPVRNQEGRAIGVVAVSRGAGSDLDDHREGGPNPALTRNLQGWLLRELKHPAIVCPQCGLDDSHGSRAECVQELRGRAAMLEGKAKAESASP
jgi:hypothetical protein